MPKKILSEDLKRVTMSVSLPKYLVNALDELPNKSEIVTQILEENADRVLAGDLNLASDYIQTRVRQEILEKISKVRYEIIDLEKLNKITSELQRLNKEANKLKIEFRDVEREARNLLMDLRNEKTQINKVIAETLEKLSAQLKDELWNPQEI